MQKYLCVHPGNNLTAFFQPLLYCTNTIVKIISQFLILFIAVSETLCSFQPQIPVSFKQIQDVHNVSALCSTEITQKSNIYYKEQKLNTMKRLLSNGKSYSHSALTQKPQSSKSCWQQVAYLQILKYSLYSKASETIVLIITTLRRR